MTSQEAWERARNILCVRLDQIGDLLMTTPAFTALKERRGDRRLTLLTSSATAPVAPLLPMIDEAIVYDAPWMKASAPRAGSAVDRSMIEFLASKEFDAAVIFTVYSQNPLPATMLCYLADIPLRLAHCRENSYQLLTDWIPEPEPQSLVRHEVQRQLDLVQSIGAEAWDARLKISIPTEARETIDRRLRRLGIGNDAQWIAVHPGGTAPSRRYPPEQFAAAIRRLAREEGLPIIFTGLPSERGLVEEVRAASGAATISFAGTTTLAELAALLERASLLVSNNSGPVHLAAAVGTPIVDLYALTNPQHSPWRVSHELLYHDVPCRNCYKSICPQGHHDCLRLVAPEEVVAACRRLLAARRGDAIASRPLPSLPEEAALL